MEQQIQGTNKITGKSVCKKKKERDIIQPFFYEISQKDNHLSDLYTCCSIFYEYNSILNAQVNSTYPNQTAPEV